MRALLRRLERKEKTGEWGEAETQAAVFSTPFEPEEIQRSKYAGLINSLSANIESAQERIWRKSRANTLDKKAQTAFSQKDYDIAKKLWEEANELENKDERLRQIRLCEDRIRNLAVIEEFEATLERVKGIRQSDPEEALDILELGRNLCLSPYRFSGASPDHGRLRFDSVCRETLFCFSPNRRRGIPRQSPRLP